MFLLTEGHNSKTIFSYFFLWFFPPTFRDFLWNLEHHRKGHVNYRNCNMEVTADLFRKKVSSIHLTIYYSTAYWPCLSISFQTSSEHFI